MREVVPTQLSQDIVLRGGYVVTADDDFTVAEAVAVRGDRILAVGTDAEVLAAASPDAHVVELAGGTVLPGIHDAHLHLSLWAGLRAPGILNLLWDSPGSIDDVVEAVRAAAGSRGPDDWVVGTGWDRGTVRELGGRSPTRLDLDLAGVAQPVALMHRSQHAVWLNTRALQLAGIDRCTPDPDGGQFVRDESGDPTGYVLETAVAVALAAVPEPPAQVRRAGIVEAATELAKLGVTSLIDPAVTPQMLRDYHALASEQALPVRVACLLHWDWPSVGTTLETLQTMLRFVGTPSGFGDDRLRVVGCKLFADGVPALGSSWHADPHGHASGGLVSGSGDGAQREREFTEMVSLLHRHRMNVQIHATGSLAAELAVGAICAAQQQDPWPDARHALIHGTFVPPALARRAAAAGVAVVTNSLVHWHGSAAWRQVMDDEEWHSGMPVGSLAAEGVVVADGSDAPVQSPDWRQGVESLMTRVARGTDTVVGPQERLDWPAALRAWTTAGAYLEGPGVPKGSLRPGYLADLVVLAQDVRDPAPQELHRVTPVATMVGGRWTHRS